MKHFSVETSLCQSWFAYHFGQEEGHFCEGRVNSYLVQEEGHFLKRVI